VIFARQRDGDFGPPHLDPMDAVVINSASSLGRIGSDVPADRPDNIGLDLGRRNGIVFNDHSDEDGPSSSGTLARWASKASCRIGFERTLPVGAIERLDQGQEPGQPGGDPGA
jgi:hypothetical protein